MDPDRAKLKDARPRSQPKTVKVDTPDFVQRLLEVEGVQGVVEHSPDCVVYVTDSNVCPLAIAAAPEASLTFRVVGEITAQELSAQRVSTTKQEPSP